VSSKLPPLRHANALQAVVVLCVVVGTTHLPHIAGQYATIVGLVQSLAALKKLHFEGSPIQIKLSHRETVGIARAKVLFCAVLALESLRARFLRNTFAA
jgi:hypothetical protein